MYTLGRRKTSRPNLARAAALRALELNPLLWSAFETLCILGDGSNQSLLEKRNRQNAENIDAKLLGVIENNEVDEHGNEKTEANLSFSPAQMFTAERIEGVFLRGTQRNQARSLEHRQDMLPRHILTTQIANPLEEQENENVEADAESEKSTVNNHQVKVSCRMEFK
jgi:hypothetical protein